MSCFLNSCSNIFAYSFSTTGTSGFTFISYGTYYIYPLPNGWLWKWKLFSGSSLYLKHAPGACLYFMYAILNGQPGEFMFLISAAREQQKTDLWVIVFMRSLYGVINLNPAWEPKYFNALTNSSLVSCYYIKNSPSFGNLTKFAGSCALAFSLLIDFLIVQ